jgi:hypothetical protein
MSPADTAYVACDFGRKGSAWDIGCILLQRCSRQRPTGGCERYLATDAMLTAPGVSGSGAQVS